MHAAAGGKQKQRKPKVSVRVNVRPLNSNWKPVKCVEKSNTTSVSPALTNPSPAHKKLNEKVWKTKNVRVEYMEVPPTPASSKEVPEAPPTLPEDALKEENFPKEEEMIEIPGLFEKCECGDKDCEIGDFKGKKLEMWDGEGVEKEKDKKDKSASSKKPKKVHKKKSAKRVSKPRVEKAHRSYSVPPNSVATPSSKKRWTKLYEQACEPSKPLEKLPVLPPGQISVSELDPEPEPLENPVPMTSPQLLKVPTISPNSDNMEVLPETPEKLKVEPPPPATAPVPPSSLEIQKPSEPVISSEEIIFLPPASTSATSLATSQPRVNLFRRAEQLYYGSEIHWWMLVGLVMLTIFAYRSSIEQHTCYYD